MTMKTIRTRNTATLTIALLAGLSMGLIAGPKARAQERPNDEKLIQAAREVISRHRFAMCESGASSADIIGKEAYDKALDALAGIVTDPVVNRPTGTESQREAAFRGINVI